MSTAAPSPSHLSELFSSHLDVICERTSRALRACGQEGLLVHSGSPLTIFEDDQSYPFKVHAPFKVWVPLPAPDCFVYFQPGHKPQLLVTVARDFWHRPLELSRTWWTDAFDIRMQSSRGEARQHLPADLSRVACLGDAFPELTAWGVGAVNPRRLMRHLDFERAQKTPYELACLREANRRGAVAHRAAEHAFASGASELAIELAFIGASGQREQELPYSPIIALNEAGATLHYQCLAATPPRESRSLLIDAGVEFAGYASDITRTHTHREAHPDFAGLIGLMDRVQQTLCDGVRAGVDWRDVQLSSHTLLAGVLRQAGLIRCGPAEAVDKGVTQVFLPHGIGHLLGLEVHDVGGFMAGPDEEDIPRPLGHPYLRLTRVLRSGFVVTMEPGLYFIHSLLEKARSDARAPLIDWTTVDALRPFGGVRIEDNLAITDSGCENLTRDAFCTVAA
jgi:Xaa-Pro dipeptidase